MILTDGAMEARLPFMTIIYDLKAWFRQLAISKTDYSKHTCHVRGGVLPGRAFEDGRGANPTRPNDP